MLKSKIHRATVTEADLNYMGSITISAGMLKASGIKEFEKVQVVNINNGARIETYTISTQKEGVICLNGAAARFFEKGDIVIIMSYTWISDGEEFSPKVVFVDERNAVVSQGIYQAGGHIAADTKMGHTL
jgi:aspartate 1-decarboxylase